MTAETPAPLDGFLSFERVTRRFGPVTAVDDVSFSVRQGEFFSLLGPSGCGKTTLMRMVAGFEEPDAGRIRLAGAELTGQPPHLRPVNMMFQSYALFPHLSVAGNIAFGLRRMRMDAAAREARLKEMLRLTQLDGLEHRKPSELSGGQRQRVALARALARGPKVLLLDEPLAALDRKLRRETQSELKRIQTETGATFLVVTHDQEEAMALSDRMAVMSKGRIAQIGPPAEIYDHPADLFTAGFIGEINLVPASLLPDGRWRVRGLGEPLAAVAAPSAASGQASLVIRPERLLIGPAPSADRPGWRCVLRERVLLGHAVSCGLDGPDGLSLQVLTPAATAAALTPAGEISVTFDPADARVIGGGDG